MAPRRRSRLRAAARLAAPSLLFALGLSLLSGCLFIPGFNKTIDNKNFAREVGGRDSDRPVRVDEATRDDVLRVLGPPHFVAPDGSRAAYGWTVLNGTWFGPLCAVMSPELVTLDVEGLRLLVLEFDVDGVLRSYDLKKQDGSLLHTGYVEGGLSADMVRYDPSLPWPRPAGDENQAPPAPAPARAPPPPAE